MTAFTKVSRELTRQLMTRIESLPPPVKAAMGLLPGGGAVLEVAENHKWALVNLARHYAKTGKLSLTAKAKLLHYDAALAAENRAYEQLVTLLDREL